MLEMRRRNQTKIILQKNQNNTKKECDEIKMLLINNGCQIP